MIFHSDAEDNSPEAAPDAEVVEVTPEVVEDTDGDTVEVVAESYPDDVLFEYTEDSEIGEALP